MKFVSHEHLRERNRLLVKHIRIIAGDYAYWAAIFPGDIPKSVRTTRTCLRVSPRDHRYFRSSLTMLHSSRWFGHSSVGSIQPFSPGSNVSLLLLSPLDASSIP